MINIKLFVLKNKNKQLYNELGNIFMYYILFFFLFSKRSKWQKDFNKSEITIIDEIREEYLLPNNNDYKDQRILNFFYIYVKNSFFSYRHFFGYYRFSKNRNNISSAKCTSLFYKNFLLKYIYIKKFKQYSDRVRNTAIILEFFNKLWYFKWKFLWVISYKKFINFYVNTPNYKKKKFRIAVSFSLKNRAMTFIPKKVKKNKKKVLLPTDIFNIGFFFTFTLRFKKLFFKGLSVKDFC